VRQFATPDLPLRSTRPAQQNLRFVEHSANRLSLLFLPVAKSRRGEKSATLSDMKLAIAVLYSSAFVLGAATDVISAFGKEWTVKQASDWSAENGVLRLEVRGEPVAGQPRRPTKFAILNSEPFAKVTVEAEVKRNGRSLIIVYAWQDENHYNYAHLSSDAAVKQNVHNGIFHVFGGERVRVSLLEGPPSFDSMDWTPVKLVFDGDVGRCYVEVNGKRSPSLEAVDLSLRWGRVGLGSFNETGDFRNVKIRGEMRKQGLVGLK
jgi:hypothetical protein